MKTNPETKVQGSRKQTAPELEAVVMADVALIGPYSYNGAFPKMDLAKLVERAPRAKT